MRGTQTKATVVAASYRAAVASLAPCFLPVAEYTFLLEPEMAKQDQRLHKGRVNTRKASQSVSHLMAEYLLVEHELKQTMFVTIHICTFYVLRQHA